MIRRYERRLTRRRFAGGALPSSQTTSPWPISDCARFTAATISALSDISIVSLSSRNSLRTSLYVSSSFAGMIAALGFEWRTTNVVLPPSAASSSLFNSLRAALALTVRLTNPSADSNIVANSRAVLALNIGLTMVVLSERHDSAPPVARGGDATYRIRSPEGCTVIWVIFCTIFGTTVGRLANAPGRPERIEFGVNPWRANRKRAPAMHPNRNRNSGATAEPRRTTVRIGFASSAKAAFDRLSAKAREGIRRKLYDYGRNPSLGKPLIRELHSFDRLTYGRVRCVTKSVDGIVLVLYCGLRKSDAVDDSYEIASAALASNDPEVVRALQSLTARYAGRPPNR